MGKKRALPGQELDIKKKRKKAKRSPAQGVPLCASEPAEDATAADNNIGGSSPQDLSSNWAALNLSPSMLEALASLGFATPMAIQKEVIPLALKGRDVLGAAETGSGKTLAFVIPIIEQWLKARATQEDAERKLFALVLAPTRELAVQVHKELKRLSDLVTPTGDDGKSGLRSVVLVGGLSQQKQERLLKRRPDVVVATPGRLWALMQEEEHLSDTSALRVLVVDEIDRMLERGHFDELGHVVRCIHTREDDAPEAAPEMPQPVQTLVFSATLTFTHAPVQRADGTRSLPQTQQMKVKRLVEEMRLRKSRHIVDLTREQKTPKTLLECRMNCVDLQHKDANLYYLLNRYGGRVLVFANSIDATRRLHGILSRLHMQPAPMMLHAKMVEKRRLKNLERFAAVEDSVLLATDVAGRGLDIQRVDMVVHYQVPKTSESYVHRSGRTARALREGRSVLFVDPTDTHLYQRIRRNLEKKSELDVLLPDSKLLMEACQRRVRLAAESESAEFGLKKKTTRQQWFERMAEEAELVLDDDLQAKTDENGSKESAEVRELRQRKKRADAALEKALKVPLPPPQGS